MKCAALRALARKKSGGSPGGVRQRIKDMKIVAKNETPANRSDLVSTVELITPEAARWMRDNYHFERQRNINQRNVDRLAAEMKAGRFTPGTQIYICTLPDGSNVIVNGNHTLEGVAQSAVAQVLTITHKRVADLDEAGRIYAVFDIQKVRSWRDSLRATGQGEDFPFAEKVLAALGVIELRFNTSQITATSRIQRINAMEDYRDAVEILSDALSGGSTETRRLITRAAVFAVALETSRYQPSLAGEFWSKISRDDGLVKGTPEKALLGWLRNVRSSTGYSIRRAHALAAASAWNAAFKGEGRDHLKPGAMSSFFLLGTPWSNGVERD